VTTATVNPTRPRKSLAPWLADDVNFYDHQIKGIRWGIRQGSFILADEMGLGKSLQALAIFCADIKQGLSETMLVCAPVTLKMNWYDEIKRFTTVPVTVLGVEDPEAEKLKALPPKKRSEQIAVFAKQAGPRILIMNYEQAQPHLAELNKIRFDIRCFDEAHMLKNPKAKRTKACMAIRAMRTFCLTGTPMLNQVNELWSLLHMVDPGSFPNYWNFVNRYCAFGGYEGRAIIGVKNRTELVRKLENYQLRRLKKDVLDLPAVQYIQRKVELHPEQRVLYAQVADDMELILPKEVEPQEIENALTRFLRLKQICGTTAAIDGYPDNSYKLDMAVEIIEELVADGHKVVVFTQFRQVLACLQDRLQRAGIVDQFALHGDIPTDARAGVVAEWKAVAGPSVIVCMLQVAGVGLNMTAARHAVFLDKLFVPGLNQQAVDRLHRIGASESQPVQVYEILCRGTIETRIEQILREKTTTFGHVVEEAGWKKKLVQALLSHDDEDED
jgi:SNF2 family DNA or RNA helicase